MAEDVEADVRALVNERLVVPELLPFADEPVAVVYEFLPELKVVTPLRELVVLALVPVR